MWLEYYSLFSIRVIVKTQNNKKDKKEVGRDEVGEVKEDGYSFGSQTRKISTW